jgi:hypothetical protein
MNQPIKEIGNVSLVEYAKNTSGVYIWMTRQTNANDMRKESARFITDGQKTTGSGNRNHNAILMWNRTEIAFKNNICPYKDRF